MLVLGPYFAICVLRRQTTSNILHHHAPHALHHPVPAKPSSESHTTLPRSPGSLASLHENSSLAPTGPLHVLLPALHFAPPHPSYSRRGGIIIIPHFTHVETKVWRT